MTADPATHTTADGPTAHPTWVRSGPAVFVVLWSTGFIGSKMGAPYAEPFWFLAVRFAIAAVLMMVIALVLRAQWPTDAASWIGAVVVGLFVHGSYLGGVFWAIDRGFAAGTSALIVSIYPLIVGVLAGAVLGERVTGRHWFGLILGFIGVALVVWDEVRIAPDQVPGAIACLIALASVTAGTLIHKRLGPSVDLSASQAVQLGASAMMMAALAFAFEDRVIVWAGPFVFAMAWLVLVLSLGGFTLLLGLIRVGQASKVSSLFYLVPPFTAVIAYLLFGETLGPNSLIGLLIAAAGVALVTRAGKEPA